MHFPIRMCICPWAFSFLIITEIVERGTTLTLMRSHELQGKILKMVREHYLRDDIWCGSHSCTECKYSSGGQKPKLEDGKKFIIIDTNVVLHQMDLLEATGDAFENLVCVQTVLQEVEHRNRKLYVRLRKLIEEKPTWYVFCNEHHRSTYIERLPKESPNDRNDRAIRAAARFYSQHLSETPVLLLTNDADNREKALREHLACKTVGDYVQGLVKTDKDKFSHLLERLANTHVDNKTNDLGFTKHLSNTELKAALDAGKIKKGVFLVKRNYMAGATVSVKGGDPIYIPGLRFYSNRAVDGDVVGIEILPKSKWLSPGRRSAPDPDEEAIGEVKSNAVPTGRVVGIFERRWRAYCGSFEESDKTSGKILFISVNQRVPKIRVESRQIASLMDKRIMVAIDSWPITSVYPLGHYVRTLGKIGDRDTETEVVLIEHEIPTAPWTVSVLKCLPPHDYTIPEEEIAKRVDLRNELICSIDPPGCTDIDDALHCKQLPNGNYQVGVHIADVTHFMRPGTALDEEAANRSTSVYLVQKRIDMIPTLLSTNLCSLHEKVDRLAFSVVWEMDKNANIVSTRYHKSVICSVGAFSYGQAQTRIDEGLTDPVTVSMRNLNNLAKILKQKRLDAGALSLASSEIKFILEKESQAPTDVAMYQMKEVNSLVEEFMLLANVSVAKKVLDHFSQFSILRRHPTPKADNFVPLQRAAKTVGFQVQAGSSKELADSLDRCVLPDNPFFNKLIRILATRCMSQAVYFSSGDHAPSEYLHYGLASPVYTHFTSPIRRYADVLVHRLLAACLGIDPLPAACEDKAKTKETCEVINHRHRMAQLASRASGELFTLIFFRDKDVQEDALITSVKSNGVGVLVPKYGIEGNITLFKEEEPVDGKPAEPNPYTYDEETLTLRGMGAQYRIFDRIRVRIYVKRSKMRR